MVSQFSELFWIKYTHPKSDVYKEQYIATKPPLGWSYGKQEVN